MQKTQIALFPLQLFLLPGERTRLHIFEDRYKQLLEDCEKPGVGFGIPFAPGGYMSGYGCMVQVERVINRHQNGSADIEVACTDLFKVEQFFIRLGEKLYPGGDVTMIEIDKLPRISASLQLDFDEYVKTVVPYKMKEALSPFLNVFDIGRILELSDAGKLQLLKAKNEAARERILRNQIKLNIAMHLQKRSIVGDLFLN